MSTSPRKGKSQPEPSLIVPESTDLPKEAARYSLRYSIVAGREERPLEIRGKSDEVVYQKAVAFFVANKFRIQAASLVRHDEKDAEVQLMHYDRRKGWYFGDKRDEVIIV